MLFKNPINKTLTKTFDCEELEIFSGDKDVNSIKRRIKKKIEIDRDV